MDLLNIARQLNPVRRHESDNANLIEDNFQNNRALDMSGLAGDYTNRETGVGYELNPLGDSDKYTSIGLSENVELLKAQQNNTLEDVLAESQSNWSKAFNALAQTAVSEVGIGIPKAFSDIADGVINGIGSAFFNTNNDYTNPVSQTLERWKESFDNEIAPIYVQNGVDISNGGLANFGWYMKNLPSIASSITLLIPGRAVAFGASKLLGMATKGRATAKALRGLRKATGIESLTSTQAINNVKQAEKMLGTALVMRTAENYQEARGTYNDMKDNIINRFNSMTPQQYSEWVNNHKDYIEKNNLDPNNKEDIADRIASDAANETFRDDFFNTVFDVVQLWGLRDASKIFRNVKSTKVMADHRASIQALNKTSEEIAEAAAKTSKFRRLGNTLSDIAKGTGKATLAESTEGIEEAINFISQQEGMTVGKTILEDLNPTSFGSRLSDYMSDPQLWESAFWGLAGGVVFHGLGSAYNQAEIKRANKKAAKKREENDKTGEKIETSKWYELEELPEIKAARVAVNGRQARLEDMIEKMTQINNGVNIFGNRDNITKALPNFEGSDDAIRLQQERARASVEDEFVADITTDAIHSGTYDLLTEYLGSPEMIKAISNRLNVNENESKIFVDRILAKSKRVRDEYNKQINHITDQVTAINNDRKNKDTVPLPYIQILAKQNLDRVLTEKNLDDQLNIIQEQINALKSNPALDGILDRNINYEDVMTIGSITASYRDYEAQKKAIKANEELGVLDKRIKIDTINKKQEILLRKLESITTINGKPSSSLGRVLYTLRSAEAVKYNDAGELVEDPDVIERTDKEILKEHGFTVTDFEVEEAAKSFSEYQDTLSAFDNLVEISKREVEEADKAGKQLKEASDQLYNRYRQLANLRIAKILNRADIAVTKGQISEQIDIIHNQNNKNRMAMIKKAEEGLLDLYTRYERPVIDNLINIALDGHQEQAKALAKEQLTDKNDDGTLFEDVFDILNLNSDNNIQLATYVKRLIDGKEWIEHIEKLKNEVGENSTTSEEQPVSDENEELNNQSSDNNKNDRGNESPLNGDKNGQGQQGQRRFDSNNPDNVTASTLVANLQSTNIQGLTNDEINDYIQQIDTTNTPDKSISDYNRQQLNVYKQTLINERNRRNNSGNSEPVIPKNAFPVIRKKNRVMAGTYSIEWNDGDAIFYDINGVIIGNGSMDAGRFEAVTGVKPGTASSNTDNSKQATNPSTGGQDSNSPNPNLEALKDNLNRQFDYLEIKGEDDIKNDKEFDPNKAVETVRQQALDFINSHGVIDEYTVTDEAKNELRAIVEDRCNILSQRLNKFKEIIDKQNPTIEEAANGLALASKIGIIESDELPNLFVVGFENFVDSYLKTAITPIKDGKKVISIQEILGIVEDCVIDKEALGYILDKMRQYLNTPEVAAKYIILDKDNLNKDFNAQNENKDNEDINNQRAQFRVNILDHVDFYNSDNATADEKENFFKVLNNLRAGDVLDLRVDGNTLFITSGETVIGSITKAIFENNKFTKINKGWVEDVTINAGGDIVSDTMEVYKRIFTSEEPVFVQLRGVILDAILSGQFNKGINSDVPVDKVLIKSIIDKFIKSDFIQSAINFDDNTIIAEGGSNIEKRAKGMLDHLIRIYNYSTQGVTFKTKEERINGINYAVENYFASLYNDYDTINRINKDTKVKIEYINDGQVNTKFESGTGHHADLPFISPQLVQSKGKIAYFSKANSDGTHIAGEQNGHIPPNAPDVLKVFAMFDRNGSISYVPIKQLMASDYTSNSNYAWMVSHVEQELRNLLEKAIIDNTDASYDALAQAINNLIVNDANAQGNIPLFAGLPRKKAWFKIDRKEGQINIFFTYNKKTEKYNAFSIYKNRAGFRSELVDDGIKRDIDGKAEDFVEQTVALLMDYIKRHAVVNIDLNGIDSDNNPSKDITSGFVHRIDGKIKVFDREFNSYNDFIVENGLARVNLNPPQNGSNFIARGREQRLNQVMYVSVNSSLPVEESVDRTKYTVEKPENKTTDDNVFLNVLTAFYAPITSGKDLFIAAYGEEAYNDMLNVAGEFDIMEAILPTNIIYNPNLNSARNSTLEAKTNPTNHTIRVNVGSDKTVTGRTRVELAPGQVMVGDKFISLLSSTKDYSRKRAIAVMIHERLHYLIENNPNYTRAEILKAITPIYDRFFELCQDVVNNYNETTATKEEKYKYLRAKKAIDDFKKYNNTKAYPDPLTKFDEFLVESITNVDYNYLLNEFESTEKVEGKPENIFTKLLNFVMKYLFGRTVRDNSLLAQEFNILNKLINNKQITIPKEQKTTATVSMPSQSSTGRQRPAIKRVVTRIQRPSREEQMFNNDEDEDSAFGVIDNYENESITGFIAALPVEQQLKFKSLINNGQLEYKCIIK